MLWRRRSDGFEWKAYVPTIVLARRRARRERIAAAGAAAVEGVKEVGRRGVEVGVEGARVAGAGLEAGIKALAELPAQGIEAAAPEIARAHRKASVTLAPITAWISGVKTVLSIAAALALAMGSVRAVQFGFDADTAVALSIAAGCLSALAIAFIFRPPDEGSSTTRLVAALRDRFRQNGEPAPADAGKPGSVHSSIPHPSRPYAMAAAALFAAVMVSLAWPVLVAGTAPADPSTADLPASSAHSTAIATTAALPSNDATAISGRARAASPGQLRIGSTLVTLDGIEPLTDTQTCRTEAGRTWDCGEAAQVALAKLARGGSVVCMPTGTASADGPRATCRARGKDIGAELVRLGHAFSTGVITSTYGTEEAEAREKKAGLWAGDGERADDWRRRMWDEAAAIAPGGCPIKGREQRSKRTYVMPGAADYARTRVDEKRGDRWFCSEDDARSAGFLPK